MEHSEAMERGGFTIVSKRGRKQSSASKQHRTPTTSKVTATAGFTYQRRAVRTNTSPAEEA